MIKRCPTEILLAVFLLFTIAVVYGQVRSFGFTHYDDLNYIVKNPHVRSGLSPESLRWAFTTFFHGEWQPLTWLSHMTDVQLFGMHPGWHHLVSLGFHAANTLLLFFLLAGITRAPIRSAVVAALFALHPLHVEAVAMVSYRKNLLSTFFMLLGMHAYVGYAKRGGYSRSTLVFVLFLMGLMAKAVIVTLPVLLLFLDYWPLGRFGAASPPGGTAAGRYTRNTLPRLIGEKLVLFAPVLIVSIVAIIARNPDKALLLRLPTYRHIANGLVAYLLYIGKTLWPANLAVIYPPPAVFSSAQVIGSGLLLLSITVMTLLGRKKRPYLAVGWGWYLLTLLPVIGILGFMGPHRIADRYTYVPIVGLFIMAAWGIPDMMEKWRPGRALMPALAGGLIFALMACTWLQVGYWKNSIFLFTHAIRVTSGNFAAHNDLGMVYLQQGDPQKAQKQFLDALKIKPDFLAARCNLGTIYSRQGNLAEAEHQFSAALRLAPDNAWANSSIGVVLAQEGRLDEAAAHLRKAIQKRPGAAGMHYYLGNVLLLQGKPEDAVVQFSEAVKRRPAFAQAHNALGRALTLVGKPGPAVEQFKEALRIRPDYAEAKHNLDRAKAFSKTSENSSR
jgi:Tfp pilus assembly protein PilF